MTIKISIFEKAGNSLEVLPWNLSVLHTSAERVLTVGFKVPDLHDLFI